MITSTVTVLCLGLSHYMAQRTISGRYYYEKTLTDLFVSVELMISLSFFGPISLLDGIIFYFKKNSFLSPNLGHFKSGLEVKGIENPYFIRIKTNEEKFAIFDGIYQKVDDEHCNGNPVWKHSNGTSKWIFFSNESRWSVGTALIVKTSFTLDNSLELEGEFSDCDKFSRIFYSVIAVIDENNPDNSGENNQQKGEIPELKSETPTKYWFCLFFVVGFTTSFCCLLICQTFFSFGHTFFSYIQQFGKNSTLQHFITNTTTEFNTYWWV